MPLRFLSCVAQMRLLLSGVLLSGAAFDVGAQALWIGGTGGALGAAVTVVLGGLLAAAVVIVLRALRWALARLEQERESALRLAREKQAAEAASAAK